MIIHSDNYTNLSLKHIQDIGFKSSTSCQRTQIDVSVPAFLSSGCYILIPVHLDRTFNIGNIEDLVIARQNNIC